MSRHTWTIPPDICEYADVHKHPDESRGDFLARVFHLHMGAALVTGRHHPQASLNDPLPMPEPEPVPSASPNGREVGGIYTLDEEAACSWCRREGVFTMIDRGQRARIHGPEGHTQIDCLEHYR